MNVGKSDSKKKWYWTKSRADEDKGPLSWERLRKLAEVGNLEPDDYVWCEDLDDWKKADSVDDLFTSPPSLTEESDSEAETSSSSGKGRSKVLRYTLGSLLFICGLISLPSIVFLLIGFTSEGVPTSRGEISMATVLFFCAIIGPISLFYSTRYIRKMLEYKYFLVISILQSTVFGSLWLPLWLAGKSFSDANFVGKVTFTVASLLAAALALFSIMGAPSPTSKGETKAKASFWQRRPVLTGAASLLVIGLVGSAAGDFSESETEKNSIPEYKKATCTTEDAREFIVDSYNEDKRVVGWMTSYMSGCTYITTALVVNTRTAEQFEHQIELDGSSGEWELVSQKVEQH
jgi:hypothetical protein